MALTMLWTPPSRRRRRRGWSTTTATGSCFEIWAGSSSRSLLNEATRPSDLGMSLFDSMVGLAVRRWCAPVLGLEPLAPAGRYLSRRRALGGHEVARRFLTAANTDEFLVDTGYSPEAITSPASWPGSRAGTAARSSGWRRWPRTCSRAGSRRLGARARRRRARGDDRRRREEHRGVPVRACAAERPSPSARDVHTRAVAAAAAARTGTTG